MTLRLVHVLATVLVIVACIAPNSARPTDDDECNTPTYYTAGSRKEAIPIGCPKGKLRAKPWDPPTLNVSFHFFNKVNQDTPTYILPWNHSFTGDNSQGRGGVQRSRRGQRQRRASEQPGSYRQTQGRSEEQQRREGQEQGRDGLGRNRSEQQQRSDGREQGRDGQQQNREGQERGRSEKQQRRDGHEQGREGQERASGGQQQRCDGRDQGQCGQQQGRGGQGKKKLLVLIHGYTQAPNTSWVAGMRNAYFNLMGPDKVDVIVVDWEYGASGGASRVVTGYAQAASNVQTVGRLTANFIARLMASRGLDEKSLHLFGHSLGGQTVGEAAHWLHAKHNIQPGRVSAMDPAEVLFKDEDTLLDRKDTYFLEIMHVTGSPRTIATVIGQVGLYRALGHVDLYPNGGSVPQPGCKITSGFFCSHNRGVFYYQQMLESAKSGCDVQGTRCDGEKQAYKQACDMGRIENIWSYLDAFAKRRLANNTQTDAPSEVIYFETNRDRLKVACGAKRSKRRRRQSRNFF